MDLFTCRNCIYNPTQGLTFGPGPGFCVQWGSLLERPERTTCKYLHRKDLPHFLVRDAQREHEAEFSQNRALADVATHADVAASEFDGENTPQAQERVDPVTRAVANYHLLAAAPDITLARRSRLMTLFAGSHDARRASAHACLVRVMGAPATHHQWWRRILDLVDEVSADITVPTSDLGDVGEASETDVRWEIADIRLSAVQEYGWHLGSEELKFPLSSELEALATDRNWGDFLTKLSESKVRWAALIKAQAIHDVAVRALPPEPAALWPTSERRFERLRDRTVREGVSNRFREAS